MYGASIFPGLLASIAFVSISNAGQPFPTAPLGVTPPNAEAELMEESVEDDDEGPEDGEDFEVVVRRHHTHGTPAILTSRRRRRAGPIQGAVYPANTSEAQTLESYEARKELPSQYLAAAISEEQRQPNPEETNPPVGPLSGPPPQSGAPTQPQPSATRGLELIIGILLGILVSLLALVAWLCCWRGLKSQHAASSSMAVANPSQGLDGGRLGLVQFHYQGAFFNQLSWTLEAGGGTSTSSASSRRDKDSESVTLVLNERSQRVARGVGRLMSTPNGEMHLTSLGGGPGGLWCILKRPAPSRRPGQLWDFKVCQANGAPYSEVRQRSETKCLVNDAVSQRRMMTVIGNFTYPVFLSGERSIHVWITQADGQCLMGAQCEAKLEEPDQGAPYPSRGSAAEHLPAAPSRRFYVTTTANTDASLVLAVLLGLQDVHRAARREEFPAESSSASTGSGWHGGHGGHRVSSGGSTAATSAGRGRDGRTESAKAAPMPPDSSHAMGP